MKTKTFSNNRTVGFISFRLAGTDGVSLETEKMADVFRSWGYRCVFMAGELDTPPEDSFLVEETHFQHPDIRGIYLECFSQMNRPPELTRRIHRYREIFKNRSTPTVLKKESIGDLRLS